MKITSVNISKFDPLILTQKIDQLKFIVKNYQVVLTLDKVIMMGIDVLPYLFIYFKDVNLV